MTDQTHPQLPAPFIVNPEVYGDNIFTRNEADGAWPNGTKVRKIYAEEGEGEFAANERATAIGEIGTVIGSIETDIPPKGTPEFRSIDPHLRDAQIAYFIEWQQAPNECVAAVDKKLEKI